MSEKSKSVPSPKVEKTDPLANVRMALKEAVPTVKERIEDALRVLVVTEAVLGGARAKAGVDTYEVDALKDLLDNARTSMTFLKYILPDATLDMLAPTDDQRAALDDIGGVQ